MQEESYKTLLLQQLKELELEHAKLDSIVDNRNKEIDEISVQRIKKRKLYLKDQIIALKAIICPDIIA